MLARLGFPPIPEFGHLTQHGGFQQLKLDINTVFLFTDPVWADTRISFGGIAAKPSVLWTRGLKPPNNSMYTKGSWNKSHITNKSTMSKNLQQNKNSKLNKHSQQKNHLNPPQKSFLHKQEFASSDPTSVARLHTLMVWPEYSADQSSSISVAMCIAFLTSHLAFGAPTS